MIYTAIVKIKCNTCSTFQTFDYDVKIHYNHNISQMNLHLENYHGWKTVKHNIHICKDCLNK